MPKQTYAVTIREVVAVRIRIRASDHHDALRKARASYDPGEMFGGGLDNRRRAPLPDSGIKEFSVDTDNHVEDAVVEGPIHFFNEQRKDWEHGDNEVAIFVPKGGELVMVDPEGPVAT